MKHKPLVARASITHQYMQFEPSQMSAEKDRGPTQRRTCPQSAAARLMRSTIRAHEICNDYIFGGEPGDDAKITQSWYQETW